jgi:hypothetical protein
MAITALLPIGVPSSSPRSVSMTGVNGWFPALSYLLRLSFSYIARLKGRT